MTRAEVDEAVGRVVHRFREAAEVEERNRRQRELQASRREASYERRQSFYEDPRYSHMGIGKRNSVDWSAPGGAPRPSRQVMSEMHSKTRSRPVEGKVFFLYASPENRKIPLSQLVVPVGARSKQSAGAHSHTSGGPIKRRVAAAKKEVHNMGFSSRIGNKRHTYIFKIGKEFKNGPSKKINVFKLANLLRRNVVTNAKSKGEKGYRLAFEKSKRLWLPSSASNKLVRGKRHEPRDSLVHTLATGHPYLFTTDEPMERQTSSHLLPRHLSGSTSTYLPWDKTVPVILKAMLSGNTISLSSTAEASENAGTLNSSPSSRKQSGANRNGDDLLLHPWRELPSSSISSFEGSLEPKIVKGHNSRSLKQQPDNHPLSSNKVKSLQNTSANLPEV